MKMINIKNKYNGDIKRGDIYWHVFDYSISPVLIIQNDTGNKYSPKTIVLKLNSSKTIYEKAKRIPTIVKINKNDFTNLHQKHSLKFEDNGFVLTSEIYTVEKSTLIDKIGSLKPENLSKIEKALLLSLGMQ